MPIAKLDQTNCYSDAENAVDPLLQDPRRLCLRQIALAGRWTAWGNCTAWR